MSKYYKAEDIMEIFSDESRPENWMGTETEIQEQADFDFYKSQIESLPTIEIVRCRECKYYEDPNHKIFENCVKWKDSHGILLPMKPNDSCSYGERIEE